MAADFTAQVTRAAGRIEAGWSPERAAAILRGVHGQKRRQRQRRALGGVAVVLLLALLTPRLVASLRGRQEGPEITLAIAPRTPASSVGAELAVSLPPLHLRDGSVARPQGRASQVRLREDRPGRTVLELAGAAQFDVVHDPRRLFRVETPGLAVEVLGTRFRVEELGQRVQVTVQEGRVRVLWASHYDELGAGQSGVFQPAPPGDPGPVLPSTALPPLSEPAPGAVTPKPVPGVMAAEHPAPRVKAHRGVARPEAIVSTVVPSAEVTTTAASPTESAPTSWQTLAHEGLFAEAYRVAYGAAEAPLHHTAAPPLLREREVAPGELLLLADVARLSHHPAEAMAPLSRLLSEHATDPRAPLAAFTLGRVLLDDLGRPREAAQSFVRVQQLDPDGPLSQDALAREVEAWSRAGEAASARTRALQYVQKYPAGRRLRSVRHFGELL